jgi:hypothetical protein
MEIFILCLQGSNMGFQRIIDIKVLP